jgi:hypothetical protein
MRRSIPAILLGTAALSVTASPAFAASGALNPDVTQTTIQQTICTTGYTDSIRPPTSFTDALKAQQITALGLSGPLSAFEEDHIVPLELGGAPRDPANLQPVPIALAHRDDVLETRLHSAVCAGTLTLAAAQAQVLAAKAGEGATPTVTPTAGGTMPSGPVKAGDGASMQGVNTTEVAGGSVILAAAGFTGIASLRRRRAGARH